MLNGFILFRRKKLALCAAFSCFLAVTKMENTIF